MSQENIVLDTNTLMNYLRGEILEVDLVGKNEIFISEITEMEIRCQSNLDSDERKILKGFLSTLNIVRLNEEIKEIAIKIRLTTRMKLMDSIIAATAQFTDLPIATCDEKFESVKTATVIVLQVVEKR